jgi:hypothetical protein
MSRVCHGCFLLLTGALVLAGAYLGEATASAQQGEAARIVTVDGVRLNAVFYPKGSKNSATVIMLHPIGQGNNIRMPGWNTLAKELHKAGYSVLMFDFRGHGESTTIEDEKAFFSFVPNRFKLKEKETIDYKDYKTAANYLPVLVNDIAAVKAFLDRKNDAGVCNTSNTIVIGADQGATLGAIWTNSEWSRYKYTPPLNNFMKPEFAKSPEGKDIIASVFLTPQPKLGATRTVALSSTLKIACKEQGMATLLFYGKDDVAARTYAKTLENALKPAKAGKKYEFIGSYDLPTKLGGVQLLQDGLKTEDLITQYLDKVVMDRGNEWVERDAQNALSMWRFPMPVYAKKQKGEKNLEFNDYQKYVQ